MKAYFTVEAALVLPVTLCVYVFLIWSMLLIHDRSLADLDIAALSMRGIIAYEEKGKIDRDVAEPGEMSKDRFLIFRYEDRGIKITGEKLSAEGVGRVTFFLKKFLNGKGKEAEELRFVYTNRKISPTMILRLCRRLMEKKEEI